MSTLEMRVTDHLPPLRMRLRQPALADLVAALRPLGDDPPLDALVAGALKTMSRWAEDAATARTEFEAFRDAWFAQSDPAAREALAENLLRAMGADRRALNADLAALDRHLDFDAFAERFLRQHRALDKRIELAALFVARAAAALVGDDATDYGTCLALVEQRRLDVALGHYVVGDRPWAGRLEVLEALLAFYRALAARGLFDRAHPTTLRRLLRLGADLTAHPALRGAALEAATLLPAEEGRPLLLRALRPRPDAPPDDFIARARVVDVVAAHLPPDEAVAALADRVWQDEPSEHLRMRLAAVFAPRASDGGIAPLSALAGRDPKHPEPSPRVRAVAAREALAALLAVDPDAAAVGPLSLLVAGVLGAEDDPLPLRVLCADIGRAAITATTQLTHHTRRFRRAIDARLADTTLPPAVAEELAWARNRLDVVDAEQHALVGRLHLAVTDIAEGGRRTFDLGVEVETPAMRRTVGRVLADLSRRDLGLAARLHDRRITLWRGDRKRRRLWRVLHELRHPAPTKRHGQWHTVGRAPRGELRAPPGRMDEVVPTTVPGERVHVRSEGGWGRHLPTVDDLLSLLGLRARPIHIFSDFGITTVSPPDGALARLRARLALSWRYAALAELRLEALAADEPERRRRFVTALRDRYGFQLHFEPYDAEMPVPARVSALFAPGPGRTLRAAAGGLPLAPLALIDFDLLDDLLADSAAFLVSWAEGGQPALALFLGAAITWFVGRGRYRRWRIERARDRVPLSIGGWGTRGKSGTERLKAALFHGLGYDVFVKTTGCEAMMMHSVPGRLPLEIFIHRPYDKATIWEQRDMLELAARMDAEVFLWECMALNPRYVSLLQHEWMHDDYATLTNAYPDHEDIQGPAGEDVARVIAEFVPRDAALFTSEEEFLPLFVESARRRNTRLRVADPLDADLLPQDLLALFPYDEHPRNINLVSRLAEALGVDPILAMHTMAQNVVPDLGVLKRFPPVRLRGRTLTFINGMSANERQGFLANWRRTGLERVPHDDPARAVATVVNNRADRVPRSQIFARLLVEDVAADRHLLIGTNLGGLRGYIETALDERLAHVTLVDPDERGSDGHRARRRLDAELDRLRLPLATTDALAARLRVLLNGIERQPDPAALDAALDAAARWLTPADLGDRIDPAAIEQAITADTAWRHALDRLFDGPHTAEPHDPPEVIGAASTDDARAAADRLLTELTTRARLEALLDAAVAGKTTLDALDTRFRAAFRTLFLWRVIAVDDPVSTGDQVVDALARALPPGCDASVMGIQNIKGTGLDFVYRWVAVEAVATRLAKLDDPDEARRIDALRALAELGDLGVLGAGTARARLAARAEHALSAEERGALDYARRRVEDRYARLVSALEQSTERSGLARLADRLEDLVDFIDALRRTRKARRLVDDLVAGRISHDQAALEMRALNARGKGGWLAKLLGR
ncbi:MAG: capsule biosynthesis protein CapB [bacterium]